MKEKFLPSVSHRFIMMSFGKKNLWQVNFLCSLLDSTTPDQDCPDLNFPTLKHLLSSYNHGKAVVQAGITHIVPFPFKYIKSFFYHSFDLLFTQ